MPLHNHRTAIEHKGGSQESFKILTHDIEWIAHQDRNVEQTTYYNCGDSGIISQINYSGWRLNGKYKYEGRPDQFEFTIKFLATAKPKLDKLHQALKSRFPGNKLLHLKDPYYVESTNSYGLNFWITEDANESDTLLENFFRMLTATDPSTAKVVSDIKDTISTDCLHWFKVMLSPHGYFKLMTLADRQKAAKSKLHHNNFQDVSSPFYLAALFVHETDPAFAIELLDEIPLFHWQYGEAESFKEKLSQKLLKSEEQTSEKNEHEKGSHKKSACEDDIQKVNKEVLFLAQKLGEIEDSAAPAGVIVRNKA